MKVSQDELENIQKSICSKILSFKTSNITCTCVDGCQVKLFLTWTWLEIF